MKRLNEFLSCIILVCITLPAIGDEVKKKEGEKEQITQFRPSGSPS